jgi:LPXTG-motif cell wall-anchored protein
LTVTNYVLQLVDMSTPTTERNDTELTVDPDTDDTTVVLSIHPVPDTEPDMPSDTIPGGGPDQVTYPPTTHEQVVVVATSTVAPVATTIAVVAPATTATTIAAEAAPVAVVAVKPATLPATGAGDAGSIALTGGLLAAVGIVAIMFARRRNARV